MFSDGAPGTLDVGVVVPFMGPAPPVGTALVVLATTPPLRVMLTRSASCDSVENATSSEPRRFCRAYHALSGEASMPADASREVGRSCARCAVMRRSWKKSVTRALRMGVHRALEKGVSGRETSGSRKEPYENQRQLHIRATHPTRYTNAQTMREGSLDGSFMLCSIYIIWVGELSIRDIRGKDVRERKGDY